MAAPFGKILPKKENCPGTFSQSCDDEMSLKDETHLRLKLRWRFVGRGELEEKKKRKGEGGAVSLTLEVFDVVYGGAWRCACGPIIARLPKAILQLAPK